MELVFPLSPADLSRWSRFGLKGGIGRAEALVDKLAEDPGELMFLKGDQVVVLFEQEGCFLGYCEGVVGNFLPSEVLLKTRLKRPVMSTRNPNVPPSSHRLPPSLPSPPRSSTSLSTRSDRTVGGEDGRGELSVKGKEKADRRNEVSEGDARVDSGAGNAVKSRRRMAIGVPGLVAPLEARDELESGGSSSWAAQHDLPDGPETPRSAFFPSIPPQTPSPSTFLPFLAKTPSPTSDDGQEEFDTPTPRLPDWEPPASPPEPERAPPSPPPSSSPLHSPLAYAPSSTHPSHSHTPSPSASSTSFPISPPHLRSQFSDASIADSLYRRRGRSSEGPGNNGLPARSAFSSPSAILASSSDQDMLRRMTSDDSGWGRFASEEGLARSPNGEDTEIFIFDSYRYSSASSIAGSLAAPDSPSKSSSGRRSVLASAEKRRRESPMTLQGMQEEEQEECYDGRGALVHASPIRLDARDVASKLRGQLEAGVPFHEPPVEARSRKVTVSTGSEMEGIPQLRDLFPRLSTADSLASVASFDSRSHPPSPHNLQPPSPSHSSPIDAPISRQLFHHFSPPSSPHDGPQSRALLGLPDSPSPTSPDSPRPSSLRKGGAKGLKIGSPSSPVFVSGTRPAWRPSDGDTTSQEDGLANSPTSAAPSLTVQVPSPQPPRNRTKEYYDDPNPPPLGSWMPKLTIPSTSANPSTYQYALPLPPSPNAPSTPFHSPSASSFSSTPNSNNNSPRSPSFSSSIHRSQSNSSLRDGPSKLRKPNLRNKTSQALLKAGLTDAAISVAGSPSCSSANDPESMRFAQARGRRTPSADYDDDDGGSSGRSSAGTLARKQSNSMFSFGKKGKEEKPAKVDYGAPVSSKDFEEETVQLGKTEFELIKPARAALYQNGDGSEVALSPAFASHPRRSFDSDDAQHSPHPRRMDSSASSPNLGQYSSHQSTTSLGSYLLLLPPPPLDERSVENHRAKELRWVQTMSALSASAVKKSKKVKLLVQAGIPSSVRGRVWGFLAEADSDKVEGLFHMLGGLDRLPVYDLIEQDVARTLEEHPQFAVETSAREDLGSVLKALVNYDWELGFAPGMACVVGLLLTHVAAPEEAFWILVALVKRYRFRNYFEGGRESLRIETLAFGFLLESVDSKLAKRLDELGVDPHTFLPGWFGTLFVNTLPWDTTLRCVDLVFFDRTLLFRIALAILDLVRQRLLDPEQSPTRESIIAFLVHLPPTSLSSSLLFPTAFTLKLRDDRIRKAIKRAQGVVRDGAKAAKGGKGRK